MRTLTSVELCAGAGGQALGLEEAGFEHSLLVDNDKHCCATLKLNRPSWNVKCLDLRDLSLSDYHGIDLLAGGLPCPPFSVAGKQLGDKDERNLFSDALRMIGESNPKFVLIENVRGFLDKSFEGYREFLRHQFKKLGYVLEIRLLSAADFGVPQLRPRVAIIAAKRDYFQFFSFPEPEKKAPLTVGETLLDLMKERGWEGAENWAIAANTIAPTIVGGSKKHGGPDLGPTRAKRAWEKLGIDGKTIADAAPEAGMLETPRLTTRMVARLQGFPDTWEFSGKKTNAYRQVGNAFPPPVANALGNQIAIAIRTVEQRATRKSSNG